MIRFSGVARTVQPKETLRRKVSAALSAVGCEDIQCAVTERGGVPEVYGSAKGGDPAAVLPALERVLRNVRVEHVER